jgi:hypothetical protein
MIKEIKISAFLLSNLLLVANFSCLYFCWRKYFIKKTLIKALFLLFFFPGSVFFRSYFAENLLLLLLIIFAYYLMEKRYYKAGLVLSLLNLTKANVFLLNGLLLVDYYCSFPRHRINYPPDCRLNFTYYSAFDWFLGLLFCFNPRLVNNSYHQV